MNFVYVVSFYPLLTTHERLFYATGDQWQVGKGMNTHKEQETLPTFHQLHAEYCIYKCC